MDNETTGSDNALPMRVYGVEISYFTGKLEAALRFMGLPYRRETSVPAGEEGASAGAARIPSLRLASGEWMTDTTPILQWLDERYPAHQLIPTQPALRFLSLLLEDYADEWLWRPAMHYRWDYEEGAQLQSRVIGAEAGRNEPYPQFMIRYGIRNRQRGLFTNGDGVTPQTWDHVESIYLDTLTHFTEIFRDRPYLLGTRPSLADFGFFGPFFRHFSMDPTSARIMRETAPSVYEWVARMWNVRSDAGGELLASPPEDWGPLLDAVGAQYLPYLVANAEAWGRGDTHYNVDIQGAPYRNIRTSIYRIACLRQLRAAFQGLPADAMDSVSALMRRHGCLSVLEENDSLGELPTTAQGPNSPAPGSMTGVSPRDTERFHLWPIRRVRPAR